MHKEKYGATDGDGDAATEVKAKRERVDIHQVCAEIDDSLSRLEKFVKTDLEKIAMLDGKLHH